MHMTKRQALIGAVVSLVAVLACAFLMKQPPAASMKYGAVQPLQFGLDLSDASTLQKQIVVGLEQEPLPALDAGNYGALTWQDSGSWALAAASGGGGSPDVGMLLSQTRLQYWSGSLGQISGETPGLNCLLAIGNSNVQPQDAVTLLGSSSRGFNYSGGAGPYFLGSNALPTNQETGFVLRGNAAGIGGFTLWTRFGIDMINPTPLVYAFAGMIDSLGGGGGLPLTSTDFTTQTTVAVAGCGFTQTVSGGVFVNNWQIISCGGAGKTVTDSGVAIVAGDLMELQLIALPDASSIAWTLKDLTAATSGTGSITTNLPSRTNPLSWQSGMTIQSSGSGGGGNAWSTVRYALESNY